MSEERDFDLFVLGAGSGGVRAARMAAATGARVAVAEERDLGGTCVNVGCIPKKLFVHASHIPDEVAEAAGFGWTATAERFDWPTLLANKNTEIARLNGIYGSLLDEAGVTLAEGRACLVDAHTVEVGSDGRRYTAENILVATGGWPSLPEIPGIENAITSNEAFHLENWPKRAIVVGGGYIAVEFAGIFHGTGVETTQLYRGPLFLRGFDDDCRRHIADQMRNRGIDLRFDSNVASLEKTDQGVRAQLDDGSHLEADVVLYATGRRPLSEGLGLEAAGVKLRENGAIAVDAYSRTNIPNIWAIGDVTDRLQLTPVAIQEAMAFVSSVFRDEPTPVDHEYVASCVFSQPPLGSVGFTEAEARERFDAVDVYLSEFRPLKHTLSGSGERTLMKLIVEPKSDRVVGIHVAGPDAGEIVQGFAVAVKCGATKAQFDATVGIHPTSAEELVTMRNKTR
jgi:glutathione reductase (NADPH)